MEHANSVLFGALVLAAAGLQEVALELQSASAKLAANDVCSLWSALPAADRQVRRQLATRLFRFGFERNVCGPCEFIERSIRFQLQFGRIRLYLNVRHIYECTLE